MCKDIYYYNSCGCFSHTALETCGGRNKSKRHAPPKPKLEYLEGVLCSKCENLPLAEKTSDQYIELVGTRKEEAAGVVALLQLKRQADIRDLADQRARVRQKEYFKVYYQEYKEEFSKRAKSRWKSLPLRQKQQISRKTTERRKKREEAANGK